MRDKLRNVGKNMYFWQHIRHFLINHYIGIGYERYSLSATAACEHGGHPRQGYEAGDDCETVAVAPRLPLSPEPSATAGKA